MEESGLKNIIEYAAVAVEVLGVAIILFAFGHALVLAAVNYGKKEEDWYRLLKNYIGKALQLSLEFLIAADIIRTIIVEPTRENIIVLGMLIIVRTILSWSITVEIEGCWPWKIAGLEEAKEE